jgi:DNA repair exonuclease SbcCD ATPase subunit
MRSRETAPPLALDCPESFGVRWAPQARALKAAKEVAIVENKGTIPGIIETQLSAWGAELDRLKAKVERQIAEVRQDYYEQIEELREDIEERLKKWGKEVEALGPSSAAQQVVRELRSQIEAELERLEPELETLKGNASRAEAEAKRLIGEIKARRKALKEKLAEFKHASGGAWEDVKTGATRGWAEFRPALHSAISKFK